MKGGDVEADPDPDPDITVAVLDLVPGVGLAPEEAPVLVDLVHDADPVLEEGRVPEVDEGIHVHGPGEGLHRANEGLGLDPGLKLGRGPAQGQEGSQGPEAELERGPAADPVADPDPKEDDVHVQGPQADREGDLDPGPGPEGETRNQRKGGIVVEAKIQREGTGRKKIRQPSH